MDERLWERRGGPSADPVSGREEKCQPPSHSLALDNDDLFFVRRKRVLVERLGELRSEDLESIPGMKDQTPLAHDALIYYRRVAASTSGSRPRNEKKPRSVTEVALRGLPARRHPLTLTGSVPL